MLGGQFHKTFKSLIWLNFDILNARQSNFYIFNVVQNMVEKFFLDWLQGLGLDRHRVFKLRSQVNLNLNLKASKVLAKN